MNVEKIVFPQKYVLKIVFNIENNKICYYKSAYYNDFWRIMCQWRL